MNDITDYFSYEKGKNSLLIELPHGGHYSPDEVKAYLHPLFTPGDRRLDSDEFSDELYLNLDCKPHIIRFGIWRAFIDPNRKFDDFTQDGIIKTHTSQNIKIYQSKLGLSKSNKTQLIKQYAKPYIKKLKKVLLKKEITHVVFCHTMPGIGTEIADDRGDLRPLVMFANGGKTDGTPAKSYYASKELLYRLAEIVENYMDDFDTDFNYCDTLRFNDPYTGMNSLNRFPKKYLLNKHAYTLEINRDLILHNPDNIIPMQTMINDIFCETLKWK